MQDIQKRKDSLVFQVWKFESNKDILPKFNLNLNDIIKVKRICHDSYQVRSGLHDSPKAIPYVMVKNNVKFESYLHQLKNVKHRIVKP